MIPFAGQRQLLVTIPGIGPIAAAAIISERGASPSEFFVSDAHLASWAGLCPGNHEWAGKVRHASQRWVTHQSATHLGGLRRFLIAAGAVGMPLVRPGDAIADSGHVPVYRFLSRGVDMEGVDQLGQALLGREEVVHPVAYERTCGDECLFPV